MTTVIEYENARRKVQAMKKKKMIKIILNETPTYGTSQIVKEIKRRFNVEVSDRSVQRVRKLMNEKGNNMSTENNNPLTDEWDTGKPEDKEIQEEQKNLNELSDREIDILNRINEGGWTIQQMAETTEYTINEIKETIKKCENMITGELLDEENPDVYYTQGTKDILDELDALPGGQGGAGYVAPKTTVVTPAVENFWEVEQDTVTACSKCDQAVDVFMNIASRRKAMLYMKWAGAREWLAYLVGEKINDGEYNVTDLYLPDQRTSGTLVDNVNTEEFNQHSIIGVIHSHHEMGAGDADHPSFSGHDDNFINSNHNLSLLAGRDNQSRGFKIVGIARVVTPCGAFMKTKANVRSMVEDPEADKVMKDEFLEKTQTQQQTYYNRNVQNGYGYGYNPYPVAHRGGHQQSQVVHPVVTGEKKTYHADANGVVQTRGDNFHFTK